MSGGVQRFDDTFSQYRIVIKCIPKFFCKNSNDVRIDFVDRNRSGCEKREELFGESRKIQFFIDDNGELIDKGG